LKEYHKSWLVAHPERGEAWLKEKLREGFDIHHIDGDKANNDPLNLVLIEAGDHFMLHNGSKRALRMDTSDRRRANGVRERLSDLDKLSRFGVSVEQIAIWQEDKRKREQQVSQRG